MPELRKDPIVDRWVVMAPERALRPNNLSVGSFVVDSDVDPFAEGNELNTPGEKLAYREPGAPPDGPGWRVRVIPNKFPAVLLEGQLEHRSEGIYDLMTALGAHEVIVECPQNESSMARLSLQNIQEVLQAYLDRLTELKQDKRLVHALIFKNKGLQAGASLMHSHSQLIATPVVPISIWEEISGALEYFRQHGRSIFADMIQQELATGSRVVFDSVNFLAFCPYASRFQFETWIVPKQPGSHFDNMPRSNLPELAHVLKTVLQKLDQGLDDPPYNYVIHTAPFNDPDLPHFSWHIEIYPRMGSIAGYEWGSGFYINPILPEEAGRVLREAGGS